MMLSTPISRSRLRSWKPRRHWAGLYQPTRNFDEEKISSQIVWGLICETSDSVNTTLSRRFAARRLKALRISATSKSSLAILGRSTYSFCRKGFCKLVCCIGIMKNRCSFSGRNSMTLWGSSIAGWRVALVSKMGSWRLQGWVFPRNWFGTMD